MLFRQLYDQTSSTYTYLLADPSTREAVVIDPVFEQHRRDAALVRELELKLVHTLDTHCHADHVTGAWLMKKAFGSRIALSKRYDAQEVDWPIDHGDVIRFGRLTLEVRATPGHTEGCVTFVAAGGGAVFTGDCLLIRGAGRTDFQHGDAHQMYHSIEEQIFTLPDDCFIYPAHDYEGRTVSTVGEEKRFNPRVGGQAAEQDFVGYMENLGLAHPKKIDIAVPANLRCGRPEDGAYQPVASWGPVAVTYAGLMEIAPVWLARHLKGVDVVDVRSPEEFGGELGHIPGAKLIPLDQLRHRLDEVPRDKPVVAVCRSGKRSGMATVILRDAGWTDVANVAGGMLRWRALSLPTESVDSEQ